MNDIIGHRYTPKLAMMALTFCFVVVIGYFVGFILEDSPMWYPNVPFPIESTPIQRGTTLRFELERCADRVVNYTFTQRFQRLDKIEPEVYINAGYTSAQKGCQTYWSQPKIIPEDLPAGEYRMIFEISAEGRLKTHNFTVRTKKFQIIE